MIIENRIAGLAIGLASPAAAELIRPLVGPVVVVLLFLAMLRIGPAALHLTRAEILRATGRAAIWQLALPFAAALILLAADLLDQPFALGVVLILAAAPITGAAHLTVMTGGDPAPALRQTVIGTLLLPLTVQPVLMLAPAFGTAAEVFGAVLRLLAVIGIAGGLALALRLRGIVGDGPRPMARIDATAAVLLGLVVIGMMGAAGEALRTSPALFAGAIAAVSALCFGLQAAATVTTPVGPRATALAVVAGNRNVALFLGVLPAAVTDDLLLVIGCYQLPMYVTPLLLPRLQRAIRRR